MNLCWLQSQEENNIYVCHDDNARCFLMITYKIFSRKCCNEFQSSESCTTRNRSGIFCLFTAWAVMTKLWPIPNTVLYLLSAKNNYGIFT